MANDCHSDVEYWLDSANNSEIIDNFENFENFLYHVIEWPRKVLKKSNRRMRSQNLSKYGLVSINLKTLA